MEFYQADSKALSPENNLIFSGMIDEAEVNELNNSLSFYEFKLNGEGDRSFQ